MKTCSLSLITRALCGTTMNMRTCRGVQSQYQKGVIMAIGSATTDSLLTRCLGLWYRSTMQVPFRKYFVVESYSCRPVMMQYLYISLLGGRPINIPFIANRQIQQQPIHAGGK